MENSLRIGVNALYLLPGAVGGTEIYLRCLLRALAATGAPHEYVVFLNRESANAGITPDHPAVTPVVCPVNGAFRPGRILWEQLRLPAECRRRNLDVLLNPGFTSPVAGTGCPTVTVFHDLQYRRHPEFFGKLDLLAWRILCGAAARVSARIVCSSPATTQDFLRYYPRPASEVTTAPLAVDDRFFKIEWSPDSSRPFLLTVSTLHPHKNIEGLLAAFRRFLDTEPSARLVLAGMRGFASASVEQQIARLGLTDYVEITGWLERDQLYALFASAHAFIYPSRFEGFGIPVAEAMAVGIPTACSKISPLREIANSGALLFEPNDEQSMVNAIQRIWSDDALRQQLHQKGREIAKQYRWSSTAALTLQALQQAVKTKAN